MPTYNGTSFDVITDGLWSPEWEQESNVSVRHIPGSTYDDVQGGGLSEWEITVEAYLTSSADLRGLQALVGATQRTLVDLLDDDATLGSVALTQVRRPRRLWDGSGYTCELTFRRPYSASAATPAAPVANWTADVSVPFQATFDPNTSTSPDDIIDAVNYEFGDGDWVTVNGPWDVSALPTTTHTYAAGSDYTVTCSVVRSGVTSADDTQSITVIESVPE